MMRSDDGRSGLSDQDGAGPVIPPMGTLVIRTWDEPDEVPAFRARLTYSRGPNVEPNMVTTADAGEALSIMREWLLSQSGSRREV